jgi:cysteine desulfurase
MIYLDYSANTPVDEAVLEHFCAVERSCPGNANSRHQAGAAAKAAIDEATQSIARSLHVQPAEIIYTSGASEANNFALKSIARLERHHGKHIISTPLEHSSVSGTLTALQEQGYEIDLVDIRQDGTVDLAHLKELLRPDTILVAVTAVDSELGVVQPVTEIAALLKDYPHCHLHVDATQAVGKLPLSSFEGIDTLSLTAHKFYGLNGIGVLVKRRGLALEPLIHGGESTTIYRSGTPTVALACSLALALLDFGGRIDFEWDASFRRERVGDVPTEMFRHFFHSFACAARCNLQISAHGDNDHHKAEAVFKAFARALRMAVAHIPFDYTVPSSKGVL